MKMSKRLFVILFTGILILSLAACGGTSKNRATADASVNGTTVDSGTDVSDQLYVFVAGQTKLEYMQKHKAGFEAACAALGVQGKFFGPDDSNIEEMTNAFEQAIAMKPNGIIICPLSDFGGMTTKALEAGIPVVYVDIDYADNDRISYAGTGDEALAEMGGEYLMDILNGEGKIAELYIPDTETGIRRSAAYEAVFARYPGVEVVARGNTKADYEIAAQAAAAILQANPDLDAFVCIDSTGGIGAATALREAGMEGQVKIISMDTDQETLSLIKDGVIDATLAQNTQLMSYYGVQVLYSVNNASEAMGYTDAMGIWPAPYFIDTGCFIVDSSNIDNFID